MKTEYKILVGVVIIYAVVWAITTLWFCKVIGW